MVLSVFDDATGPAGALARPTVTVEFAAGGGGSALSGLGGALAGLAGIGGDAPALADGLIALTVRRGVVPAVDVAELLLTPVPGGPSMPGPGDAGRIGLVAGGQSSEFACAVELVEHRSRGVVRLTATNGGRLLAQSRVDRSYADQTPGAIIEDLAAVSGVASTAGSAGETLPRYVADGGRSVLEHIHALAATAGRLSVFDDAGDLVLIDDTASGESVATFAAGETLLDYRIHTREGAGTVNFDGAGAADVGGGNEWAWLRKEAGPTSASAGDGLPQHRRSAPWVRSPQAAADLAGANLRAQARVAALGRFLVPAAPAVVPGAIVTVAGTDVADGSWRTLAVTLRFDRATGMTSEVQAAPAGAGADVAFSVSSGLGGL